MNFIIILIGLFATLLPLEAKSLRNKLSSSDIPSLHLKWKTRIGLTTYRTTLQATNGLIFAPSNGQSSKALTDPLDGVHILDGKTGTLKTLLVSKKYGDRDVNGVAISASKIVFGDDTHVLTAMNWNYEPLWSLPTNGDFEGAPALAHLNSDSILDVIAANEAGEVLAVNGKTGRVLWHFKPAVNPTLFYPKERSFMGSPTLVDVNKDSIRDILIGSRNGIFYALNGKTGEILWKRNSIEPSGILSSPFATQKHLYFSESYGYIHQLTHKGRAVQQFDISKKNTPSIVAMPVINKHNIMLVGTTFSESSAGLWTIAPYTSPSFDPIGRLSGSAILANVDTLPDIDFIVITESGWLLIISEKGKQKARFKLPRGAEASPLVADVDQDGLLELLIASTDQFLYCYDLPSKGPVIWGQFRANPYNTGLLTDTLSEDSILDAHPYHPELFDHPISLTGFNYDDWFSKPFSSTAITETSIGPARLGLTLDQFKKRLNKPFTSAAFRLPNGLNTLAIRYDNDIQFYLVFPQQKPITDESVIQMIITNNPQFKTSDGISSGMLVNKVKSRLGPATFSYNRQYPLEEKIRFQKQPRWLVFSSYSKKRAGIYRGSNALNITKMHQPNAAIQFIIIR